MTSQEKIEESHFFLWKLRDNTHKIPDAYYYYSAFLNASSSILDHLMEEYAQKFNLKIPLDVRNLQESFLAAAKAVKNTKALDFHKWFIMKRNYLTDENEYGKVFSKKRHYNIHRDANKPNQTMVLRQTAVEDEGILSFIPARGKSLDDKDIKKLIESETAKKLEQVNEKLKADGKPLIKDLQKVVIMYDEGLGAFDLCSAADMYLLNIETIVKEAQLTF